MLLGFKATWCLVDCLMAPGKHSRKTILSRAFALGSLNMDNSPLKKNMCDPNHPAQPHPSQPLPSVYSASAACQVASEQLGNYTLVRLEQSHSVSTECHAAVALKPPPCNCPVPTPNTRPVINMYQCRSRTCGSCHQVLQLLGPQPEVGHHQGTTCQRPACSLCRLGLLILLRQLL